MSQIELHGNAKTETTPPELIAGTAVVGVPILLTAVRCTLQYILVPFVLPLFSISGAFSPLVNMGAGAFGLGVILFNVRRLWGTTWRWRYIGLCAVVIPFLLLSLYFDFVAYRGY